MILSRTLFVWTALVPIAFVLSSSSSSSSSELPYGVDVSWPMQHAPSSDGTAPYHERYWQYMQGCYQAFGKGLCDSNDADRIAFNAIQPSRQKNFTSAGYAKVRAPSKTFALLNELWSLGQGSDNLLVEAWDRGNIYTNQWDKKTMVLMIDDPDNMHGLSLADRNMITHEVQTVLESWTGVPLTPTSLYGIRAYRSGSILAPHVDRLPLVISAIINVAQDVEEPWPLEIIGHDGVAVNVTMEPGDMVLYESHSVIHGRPYPLKGTFFANVFVHFEPFGYTQNLERRLSTEEKQKEIKLKFEEALLREQHVDKDKKEWKAATLPSYIVEGSKEAIQWRQEYMFQKEDKKLEQPEKKNKATEGVTNAHLVAASGDVEGLKEIAKKNKKALLTADANGWQPIHEAARGGHTKAIEFLIQQGAELNARTNDGKGASPLWWAEHMLPNTHPAIQLLRRHGAVAIAPGD